MSGVEPPTAGVWILCSTAELHWQVGGGYTKPPESQEKPRKKAPRNNPKNLEFHLTSDTFTLQFARHKQGHIF